MSNVINAYAPGKIILSGEHAVVYGGPVLAMAVNYSIIISIAPSLDNNIYFEFVDSIIKTTLSELKLLRMQIDLYDKKFKLNYDLIQYAFVFILENLNLKPENGLRITVKSTIPIGSGMGSSAAMILSLMHAMVKYFNCDISSDKYLEFGRSIENLQHGKSSGTDLFLSLHGGCYFSFESKFQKRDLPKAPLFLVNTKKPQSSTGDCVAKVAKFFHGSGIVNDFAVITTELDQAFRQNNLLKIQECIHENHKLLNYIGVVPERVFSFIKKIEELGNAAKISGAGAVSGQNAGMVLVAGEADFSDLAKQYDYEVMSLIGEDNGARIISG